MSTGTAYLDSLITKGEAWARKVYFDNPRTDYLTPTFILDCKHEAILVLTPWNNDHEKYTLIAEVGRQARSRQARGLVFICETWSSVYRDQDDINTGGKPSQRIDKLEGLQVCATDGKANAGKFWLILRDAKDFVETLELDTRISSSQLNFKILEGLL